MPDWCAAGLGEEVSFRGFVQSRQNESFGRPWRLLGVDLGPGFGDLLVRLPQLLQG
jgi:hypothetical protein